MQRISISSKKHVTSYLMGFAAVIFLGACKPNGPTNNTSKSIPNGKTTESFQFDANFTKKRGQICGPDEEALSKLTDEGKSVRESAVRFAKDRTLGDKSNQEVMTAVKRTLFASPPGIRDVFLSPMINGYIQLDSIANVKSQCNDMFNKTIANSGLSAGDQASLKINSFDDLQSCWTVVAKSPGDEKTVIYMPAIPSAIHNSLIPMMSYVMTERFLTLQRNTSKNSKNVMNDAQWNAFQQSTATLRQTILNLGGEFIEDLKIAQKHDVLNRLGAAFGDESRMRASANFANMVFAEFSDAVGCNADTLNQLADHEYLKRSYAAMQRIMEIEKESWVKSYLKK